MDIFIMSNSKKAQEFSLSTLVKVIIVLVVLIVILLIFSKYSGTVFSSFKENILNIVATANKTIK